MNNEELINIAKKARGYALSPFSKFKVGSALLTKEGKVFSGCNFEDPSCIGVTNICAERCAVVKALSEGYKEFDKIAVVGGIDELIFCTPCGVCRQYLNNIAPNIKIICLDGDEIKEFSLAELLPYGYSETFD